MTKIVLEKKMSSMSATSTVSRASSGSGGQKEQKPGGSRKSLSRGALLRQMGEAKGHTGSEGGEEQGSATTSAAVLKECVLGGKTRAAQELVARLKEKELGTEELVGRLEEEQEKLVKSESTEDTGLAGYAEATVSLLLAHLDKKGVSKVSLEELVTSRLLLDVPGVARRQEGRPSSRVRSHKVQILLRAEVHWLLASKERQGEYEDAMLAHLRQVALHDSNPAMLEFLGTCFTECYLDRQPELLCTIFEELDLERPRQLAALFSPTSSQPGSVKSVASQHRSALVCHLPPASCHMRPASCDNLPPTQHIPASQRHHGPTSRHCQE